MRRRIQQGQYTMIGNNWYIRYWEASNQAGVLVRKRITRFLAPAIGRSTKNPPADVITLGNKHMLTINSPSIQAERTLTMPDFFDTVYWRCIAKRFNASTLSAY